MGDGTTVTCTDEGTAFRESFGDRRSPTCGHVYTRTSQDEPSGRYQVTATSHWVVEWAGAGQDGTITLDHVATAEVVEGELQVLTR